MSALGPKLVTVARFVLVVLATAAVLYGLYYIFTTM